MNVIEVADRPRRKDAELKHVRGGKLPLLAFTAAIEESGQRQGDASPQWVRIVTFDEKAAPGGEVGNGHRRRAPARLHGLRKRHRTRAAVRRSTRAAAV